jgi:hypothetical protein
LWTELLVLAPESLRKEQDQARAAVDFLVALVYLTTAFGLLTFSGLIGRGNLDWNLFIKNWGFVAVALGAFVIARLWYLAAVVSSSYWYSTVQALVDVGRGELAEHMGLHMPATLEEERRMWQAVRDFVVGPHTDRLAEGLNPFRAPVTSESPASPTNRHGFLAWLAGRGAINR